MSIDLQTAFEGDMAVINEDGTKNYVENDDEIIEAPVVEESSVVEVDAKPTNDAESALFGD
jgi:hypothetical protein